MRSEEEIKTVINNLLEEFLDEKKTSQVTLSKIKMAINLLRWVIGKRTEPYSSDKKKHGAKLSKIK